MTKLLLGDCAVRMKELESESVDLVVTSPPYDSIRNYNGYKFDFETIGNELFRLLKKGGIIVWVVKDSINKGNRSLTSFKQALFFQSIGLIVYDIIIYEKASATLPHPRRYRDAHEFMFIFSKGRPKTVNLLSDRKNRWGGTTNWGQKTVRETDGKLTKRKSQIVKEYGVRYNIWRYNTGKRHSASDDLAFKHPAIFPEKLAEDHILSWSNPDDLVLDPMMGSGTTGKTAVKNGRNFIGIEISEEYLKIAEERINKVKSST
ncbi:MAG: site-specific DNA-methyltransferase [Candidatus Brocadia sp. WS118]|nr:MAG: site-specific DNA-methyltransferase [Candidatus Brocadia sp. WS118]